MPFPVKLFNNYINNKMRYEQINSEVIKIDSLFEETYIRIKPSCVIIYSNVNFPQILKIFNIYNKNIFVCDFEQKDFFWLNRQIKISKNKRITKIKRKAKPTYNIPVTLVAIVKSGLYKIIIEKLSGKSDLFILINPLTNDLNVRKWECKSCHYINDRDINASINILDKGIEMYFREVYNS